MMQFKGKTVHEMVNHVVEFSDDKIHAYGKNLNRKTLLKLLP